MDAGPPLLRVDNIIKHFGSLSVLDGISFTVEERQILGIAGPNGAGKTTLFNLISGLLPLSGGDIYFREQKISNLKPYQICILGITRTFQIPVVFPNLTVRKNVSVGTIFGNRNLSRKNQGEVIDRILNLLEIEQIQASYADRLNLYHKKLVMLAAAVATNPQLLLLDEPLAGLTYAEIEHFMRILKKLNEEQRITLIIIEHLIDWLRFISREMLIIHNGTIMALGPPEQVVKDASVIEIYLGKEQDEPRG